MAANKQQTFKVAIQIIGWGILFALPLFFTPARESFNIIRYIDYISIPFSFMMVFYVNYLFIIKRYLIDSKQTYMLFLLNFLLIAFLAVGLSYFHQLMMQPDHKAPDDKHISPMVFVIRDFMSMWLTTGLAVAIKMTGHWYSSEYDRKELEKAKTEAELSNLKSQLNPHFLFNTLNNIYSLINIDTDRAQNAVHDLSHLLRYVLYENNQNLVPLDKEVKFIRSYIELMSMRMSTNFHSRVNLPETSSAMVAPMLLITLVENAFKHGVNNTKDCFIHVDFSFDESNQLHFTVVNSNYSENSGNEAKGIGLDNMRKRLELLYPNRYKLRLEDLGQTYVARLSLKLTPNER